MSSSLSIVLLSKQIRPIDSSYLAEFVVDGPGDQCRLADAGVSQEDDAAQLPAAVAAVHPHREEESHWKNENKSPSKYF